MNKKITGIIAAIAVVVLIVLVSMNRHKDIDNKIDSGIPTEVQMASYPSDSADIPTDSLANDSVRVQSPAN